MNGLLEDLRYACTGLRRSPGRSAVIIATMALVIGLNTAAFSLAREALFQKPDFAHDVARIVDVSPKRRFSEALLEYWQANNSSFHTLTGSAEDTFILSAGRLVTPVAVTEVVGNYFTVFAAPAALGRTFSELDVATGTPAVISDPLWTRAFGRDPAVLGRTIRLGPRTVTVVGVMAPAYSRGLRTEIWMPIAEAAAPCAGCAPRLQVSGLLRTDDVTEQKAARELTSLHERFLRSGAAGRTDASAAVVVESVRWRYVSEHPATVWFVISPILAYLLLLVAWANLTTHFLGQAVKRRPEIAARISVGGSRWRIIRLVLVESATLAALGTALGMVLSMALSWAVYHLVPGVAIWFPNAAKPGVDMFALGYAAFLAAGAVVAVGLVPGFQLAGVDLNETLREAGHSQTGSRTTGWMRSLLIAFQMAVGVFAASMAVAVYEPGSPQPHLAPDFRSQAVVSADLLLDLRYPTREERANFLQATLDSLGRRRTVKAAAAFSQTDGFPERRIVLDGVSVTARKVVFRGDYFGTFDIPLLAGKTEAQGEAEAARQAIVNEPFARSVFGDPRPLGRRFQVEGDGWWTVVAIAAESGRFTSGSPEGPTLYLAASTWTSRVTNVVVRSDEPGEQLIPALRAILGELSAWQQPVASIRLHQDQLMEKIEDDRRAALVFTALAVVILAIAAVGLNGVVTFQVAARSRELGVRMALGATPGHIVGSVLTRITPPIVVGALVGLAGFAVLFDAIGLSVWHHAGMVALPTVGVLVAAFAAALLPALQIARRDPMLMLRRE